MEIDRNHRFALVPVKNNNVNKREGGREGGRGEERRGEERRGEERRGEGRRQRRGKEAEEGGRERERER